MKSLLLLPALFCLLPQSTPQNPQTTTRAPELPGPIDTPQGQIGPLGYTYLSDLPIVSTWLELHGRDPNQLMNALVALGWELEFDEAERRWLSNEEMDVVGKRRKALVPIGGRLLLRGSQAQVAALGTAIKELSPHLNELHVEQQTSRTFRPTYIDPQVFHEVAKVLTGGRLSVAQTHNGGILVSSGSLELEQLAQWLAENDQPPPAGRLVLEAFICQEAGQAVDSRANELPEELAAGLADIFPGWRFVRAEGAIAAFSATGSTPLSLLTRLYGMQSVGLPDAQLRLNAEVGRFDPERGSLSLRKLQLALELPNGATQSLATEIVLEPGVPTLLGSLNGNRVLFVLRLMVGPG